jgi:hypothetical protein
MKVSFTNVVLLVLAALAGGLLQEMYRGMQARFDRGQTQQVSGAPKSDAERPFGVPYGEQAVDSIHTRTQAGPRVSQQGTDRQASGKQPPLADRHFRLTDRDFQPPPLVAPPVAAIGIHAAEPPIWPIDPDVADPQDTPHDRPRSVIHLLPPPAGSDRDWRQETVASPRAEDDPRNPAADRRRYATAPRARREAYPARESVAYADVDGRKQTAQELIQVRAAQRDHERRQRIEARRWAGNDPARPAVCATPGGGWQPVTSQRTTARGYW